MKNNSKYTLLYRIGLRVVLLFFCTIIFAIWIAKLTVTCHVTHDENVLFIPESIWTGFSVIACMVIGIVLTNITGLFDRIEKYLSEHNKAFYGVLTVFLLIVFTESVLWVMFSEPKPISDQQYCLLDAKLFTEGDYSSFHKGGYLYRCANQIGLVLSEAFFLKLFPGITFRFFCYLNTAFVTGIAYLLNAIARELHASKTSRLFISLFIVIFPLLPLYSTFVYGTIPGMFFAGLSILFAIRFAKEKKAYAPVISLLSLWLSIFLKENFRILGVAIALYWCMELIKERRPEAALKTPFYRKKAVLLLAIVLCAFVTAFGTSPVKKVLEHKGILEENSNMSNWSFLVMGLNEDTSKLAPGWWDGYNLQTFEQNDYSRDAQAEVNKADFLQLLQEMKADPKAFIRQAYGKQVSQWCETTYESLWVSRTQLRTFTEYEAFPTFYNNERNAYRFTRYMNVGILILLFGVVLFCFGIALGKDRTDRAALLPMIFLIGGALFHIFWEAKSQYTYVYIIFLLPLMAIGTDYLTETIGNIVTLKRAGEHFRFTKKAVVSAILFLALTGMLTVPMKMMVSTRNSVNVEEYLRMQSGASDIESGYYIIRPSSNPQYAYVFTEDEIFFGTEGTPVYADVSKDGAVVFRLAEEKCLVRDSDVSSGSCGVHVSEYSQPKYCEFRVIRLDDGTYIIRQKEDAHATVLETEHMDVNEYRDRTAGRFLFERYE